MCRGSGFLTKNIWDGSRPQQLNGRTIFVTSSVPDATRVRWHITWRELILYTPIRHTNIYINYSPEIKFAAIFWLWLLWWQSMLCHYHNAISVLMPTTCASLPYLYNMTDLCSYLMACYYNEGFYVTYWMALSCSHTRGICIRRFCISLSWLLRS